MSWRGAQPQIQYKLFGALALCCIFLSGLVAEASAGTPIVVTPDDYWYSHSFGAVGMPVSCNSVYADSTHERQWPFDVEHMNLPRAWAITTGNEDCMIAINDDNIDIWHYDLKDRIYRNLAEVNGSTGIDDDGDGLIDNYSGWDFDHADNAVWPNPASYYGSHGTTMTSIIAAETDNEGWWPAAEPQTDGDSRAGVAGITWQGSVYPMTGLYLSAIANTSPSFTDNMGNGIKAFWHVAKRIDLGDPIRVINNSWRWPDPNYCEGDTSAYATSNVQRKHLVYYRTVDAINACMDRGCVVVTPTDNFNQYMYPQLPSSYDRTLCVAAVDATGDRWIHGSSGANWGPNVDVCGYASTGWNYDGDTDSFREFGFPYDNVFVLDTMDHVPEAWRWCGQPSWSDSSRVASATDMMVSGATAQATGVAALVASAYPDLSADQVIAMVKRGAVNVDAQNTSNCNGGDCAGMLGAGRIDAYRALSLWGHVVRDSLLSGDVYVSGDVTIDSGVTVTVAAGTQFHIAPDDITGQNGKTVLIVEGALSVEGTESNPVVFSAWSVGRGFDDWEGIYVASGGELGVEHARICNAEYGIYSEGTASLASADIDSCGNGIFVGASGCTLGPDVEVTNMLNIGVTVANCEAALSGLRVVGCGLHGVLISTGSVTLEGASHISNCQGSGFRVEYSTAALAPVSPDSLTIVNSGNAGVYALDSILTVENVSVTNSATAVYSASGSYVTLADCTIHAAEWGVTADYMSEIDASAGGSYFSSCTKYVGNGNSNSTLYAQNNCWDGSETPPSRKFLGLGPIVWLPAECQ